MYEWEIAGRRYDVTMVSYDGDCEGMALELTELPWTVDGPTPYLEIHVSDVDGAFTFRASSTDVFPLEVIERFIGAARRVLAPFEEPGADHEPASPRSTTPRQMDESAAVISEPEYRSPGVVLGRLRGRWLRRR